MPRGCTCMSQKPGIRNLPRPSTTCAPCGTVGFLPTAVIRLPVTTTVMSGCGAEPVPSIRVTLRMASTGDCARGNSWAPTSTAIKRRTHDLWNFICHLVDVNVKGAGGPHLKIFDLQCDDRCVDRRLKIEDEVISPNRLPV